MAATVALELGVDLGPSLSVDEARAIFARGEEAVGFALLELAGRLKRAEGRCASVSSPATPSGMTPVHQKSTVAKKRGKKPGRKAGHRAPRRTCRRGHHQRAALLRPRGHAARAGAGDGGGCEKGDFEGVEEGGEGGRVITFFV